MPMNWSNVTLKQFHELSIIERSEGLPVEKAIKRLRVLGITPDDSSLINLISQVPEFLSELPKDEIRKVYIINKKEYRPVIDFVNMNPSRFLDIYHQVQGKDPQDVAQWAPLLALVLTEHGEPYDYKTHMNRVHEIYTCMTFDQIYPLVVFFSKVWTLLRMTILDSSMEQLKKATQELTQSLKESTPDSQNIGDGSHTLAK